VRVAVEGRVFVLEEAKRALVERERLFEDPPAGFALLEVLACGVCHTDLGFADGDVAPKHPLPLVLGHEVVGRVLSADRTELVGRRVLVPAVSPCGECPACKRGRATACPKGRMPGNDADGGFASHCYVPSRDLLALDAEAGQDGLLGKAKLEAWQLAPLADAGTTAWQAIVRAGLSQGDLAVFVGTGGVGGFGAQLARSVGATVVALDVDAARLETLAPFVDHVIDVKGLDARAVRKQLRAFAEQKGLADAPMRVFETSGHPSGQDLAFTLLSRGGSLSVVGFTPAKVQLRFSNIMALDADVHGNWGCDPALYPGVVDRALSGEVALAPFLERRPLDEVNDVLDALRAHSSSRRAVLIP